ncbi:MAG TPA: hypothetical protein VKU19_10045 [Bryobacteraceae bacterium]|nr:hypothetical protein [Bryobacteraceae bacterium]
MLRVSYTETAAGQRWSLCGDLAGPWVEELRASWLNARQLAPRAPATLDLSDVLFIDEAGEKLLSEMQRAGTEFVTAGVDNKHVLASLKARGKRPLRRRVEHLGNPCEERG